MRLNPVRARRERRETELAAREAFRAARRLADEDVTVFGEQLAALHEETLTDALTDSMREDYQAALGAYDDAKAELRTSTDLAGTGRVDSLLRDGRFRLACVLARRDGQPLPRRRDDCFFNPHHGPASRDLPWTPPGGVVRDVAVCFGCAERLAAGDAPDHRMVRVGDRWVRWYAAGGSPAEVSRVQAHVIRGTAWHSRVNEAEALTRAGAQQAGRWTAGG